MDDPDADLVRRIGGGDAQAIDQFVRLKLPRMTALAHRLLGDAHEAEDVVQDLFVRVWRQAKSWTPGVARFDTWMHRVALNLCADRLRRVRPEPLPPGWDAPGPAPNADARIEEADRARLVDRALRDLPDRQREAIVLVHYQGLGGAEAAGAMEISVEALESLLARARRTLRAALLGAEG